MTKSEIVATTPLASAKSVEKPVAKPATKTTQAPVKKSAPKTAAATPAKKVAPKTTAPAAAKAEAAKAPKAKKPKLVRDSLTMPKAEYEVLATLKARAAKLGASVKKTELIRAGIKAIAAMTDAGLLSAIRAVPSLKTGRPAKE